MNKFSLALFSSGVSRKNIAAAILLGAMFLGFNALSANAQAITEGFDAGVPATWTRSNVSAPVGASQWSTCSGTAVPPAQSGTANSCILVNFNSTTGTGTISNWLLTPNIATLKNGDVITFYTRAPSFTFPDRLQVRLSQAGASTNVGAGAANVGDFTTLLLDINPNYTSANDPTGANGYPTAWTQFTITLSGLPTAGVSGRIGFRYFVEDGGPDGANSNIIGLDTFAYTPATTGPAATNSRADFDGDGRSDLSVFRGGNWFVRRSGTPATPIGVNFGAPGDVLLPGDYDGDNKTDFAIYRQAGAGSATDFYVLNSIGNTVTGAAWGDTGDIPKNGDFTGDNKDDLAVYRPSTNTFFVLPLGAGAPASYTRTFGAAGGQPYVLFYDNDLTADLATRNGANWFINRTTPNTTQFVNWGIASDRAVSADYDNDNRDDIAVFRGGTSQWFVLPSNGGAPITFTFGSAGDIPVPGDYDGDGDDEPAVFRNGNWYVQTTTSGAFTSEFFGSAGDRPVATAYVQE